MNRRNMDHLSLPVRRYRGARNSLLLMMIMTVVNMVLAAVGSYTCFVFPTTCPITSPCLAVCTWRNWANRCT